MIKNLSKPEKNNKTLKGPSLNRASNVLAMFNPLTASIFAIKFATKWYIRLGLYFKPIVRNRISMFLSKKMKIYFS